jgi:hypothetical protein
MNTEPTGFRDRLLAVEPLSPASAQQLEQELHHMFTRNLSPFHRIFISIVAVGGLASAVLCGYLAATEQSLPTVPRIGLATGTLFGLAWAWFAARIANRGTMDLRVDHRRMAAMVWVFTVLMMTFFLVAGMSHHDRLLGVAMITNGLAFLIGAGVYFITFRIEQAELAMREKLLQIELRLAELCEKESRSG